MLEVVGFLLCAPSLCWLLILWEVSPLQDSLGGAQWLLASDKPWWNSGKLDGCSLETWTVSAETGSPNGRTGHFMGDLEAFE